jgi:hypothetical protein
MRGYSARHFKAGLRQRIGLGGYGLRRIVSFARAIGGLDDQDGVNEREALWDFGLSQARRRYLWP